MAGVRFKCSRGYEFENTVDFEKGESTEGIMCPCGCEEEATPISGFPEDEDEIDEEE